jgi:lipopolysaccharide export system protein LptA
MQLWSRFGASVVLPAMIAGSFALAPVPKTAQAQTGSSEQSITVRADVQEANSKTGVVTARGNVQINYPARNIQATATQAQYFSNERRLVLSGNVYVTQEGNTLRGETITYLIDEGRFVALPQENQQVESTYIIRDNPPSN